MSKVAPDPRRLAAEILLRVERSGAWASPLLDSYESRFPDRRDRALLHQIVLGVLRNRLAIDSVVQAASARPLSAIDEVVLSHLRVGAYTLLWLDRIPDHAAVSSAVASVLIERPRAVGFANGVLRTIARRGDTALPQRPEGEDVAAWSVWTSHPQWYVERLVTRLGWPGAQALLEANNRPVQTTLRPNPLRTNVERLAATLSSAGCRTRPGRVVPDSLRVFGGSPSGALSQGLCWVQDEASQLVSMLAAVRPGMRVADLCAAPGGKTMHLASLVGPTGQVVAVDRHSGRMARLRRNIAHTGFEQVLPIIADMTAPPPFCAGFDRVLVDAPCSGTGTLRRHPEIRWRLTADAFKLVAQRQVALLVTAARLVDKGGRLIYSVCSMEPEEGEQVLASFLQRTPGFAVVDPAADLPQAAREQVCADRFVRTAPASDGLDGFFAAVLERA